MNLAKRLLSIVALLFMAAAAYTAGHLTSCSLLDGFTNRLAGNHSSRFRVDKYYTYSPRLIDIPPESVIGTGSEFREWRSETKKLFRSIYDEIPISPPVGMVWGREMPNEYGVMIQYHGEWKNGNPMHGSTIGGTIALPKTINAKRPLIVFIHGHGMLGPLNQRSYLFASGSSLPAMFQKAGYIVWVPDNVFHDELLELFKTYDYSLMWAKVTNQAYPFILQRFKMKWKGRYLVGIAAGGLTALSMAVANDDYKGLITGGAFFPLELTRRDYRIKGHPFCHDFRQFASYTSLYALVLGKPIQIQMGKKDALWIGPPLDPNPELNFSGTRRGVFTEETLGSIRILQEIAGKVNGKCEFILHEGGHTDIDAKGVFAFIDSTSGVR